MSFEEDMMESLVQNIASNGFDEDCIGTHLLHACEKGYLDIASFLIPFYSKKSLYLKVGLSHACDNGELSILCFLVNSGVRASTSQIIFGILNYVNRQKVEDDMPQTTFYQIHLCIPQLLEIAIGLFDLVKCPEGVDFLIDQELICCRTLLVFACTIQHDELIEYIVDEYVEVPFDVLNDAIQFSWEVATYLLNSLGDLNDVLVFSAQLGYLSIVQYLVEEYDVDVSDGEAMRVAITFEQEEVIEYLAQFKEEIDLNFGREYCAAPAA